MSQKIIPEASLNNNISEVAKPLRPNGGTNLVLIKMENLIKQYTDMVFKLGSSDTIRLEK